MKKILLHALAVCMLLLSPPYVSSQETYKFERMWPVLKQPWYFFRPTAVATDSLGNIYVTDWGHDCVLKFTQDGSFVTSWGGTDPVGIATHEETINNELFIYVYVIVGIVGNNRVAKFTSDGSLIWQRHVLSDPEDDQALKIKGIAIDVKGDIFITDSANICVKKLDGETDPLTSIKTWRGDFNWPCGIDVDAEGNIYVTDTAVADTEKDRILRIDHNNYDSISPWYGYGSDQGEFDKPFAITIDANQKIYVTNSGNGIIQKFSPDGIMASWKYDGVPNGIAVVPAGYIYVQEWTQSTQETPHKRIVRLGPDGTPLSIWASEGEGNGVFNQPYGIALYDETRENEENKETYIYVSDTFNNRIQKFNSEGTCIQTWGRPDWVFNHPEGIAIDAGGNIYIADQNNHLIRKINRDGSSSIWSLENTDYPYPIGVAVEPSGLSVYVAARNEDYIYSAMKVNTINSDISVWGPEDCDPLNCGRLDCFCNPQGVTVGPDGYIYVADTFHSVIKKCNPDGSCEICANGLVQPVGVAVDSASNIYVADSGNDSVKIFYQDGHSITLGEHGSMPRQFSFLTNLAVGSDGKIYVSDTGNNRIQVFKQKQFEVLTNPKAIIVAGGGPYQGNTLWDATQVTANFAYRTLIYRGFTDNDIYYLSADTDLDIDNDGIVEVDSFPNTSNLRSAITEWTNKENEKAESLILYLNDHGGPDTFKMYQDNDVDDGIDDGILHSATLASWLDDFQKDTTRKVAVIYEACESGSFIDNLQGNDRIIITSTRPEEQAKFLNEGTLSFSSFFWTHIFNGLSIGDSYLNAVDIINFAFSNQNPMLWGNAQNIYIGGGVPGTIGAAPSIGKVSDPQEIGDETSAPLSAEGVTDPNVIDGDGISRVWAVIWPPDFIPASSNGPLIKQLPSCELFPVDDGDDGLYQGTCNEFTQDRAAYQIAIYAMDRNNNTSRPQLTTVSKHYHAARRAIIVAGGSSDGFTRSLIDYNASLAYNALKAQQYKDGHIYYLSAGTDLDLDDDGVPEVDSFSTTSNLQIAITQWAFSDLNEDIENYLDLTIYLIGEGAAGTFKVNDENTEPELDMLSASELDGLLDSLPAETRVKIIYDGDKSGSFIAPLATPEGTAPPAGSERIIITSATEDGPAYFNSAGDICFSFFFWSQIAGGATVYKAFAYARQAISYLSLNKEISFSCYPLHLPLIDADGDGTANEPDDYAIARARSIGLGTKFAADTPPVKPTIGSASVEEVGGEITISAENITPAGLIQRVWAIIKPIAYCPGHSGEKTQEFEEIKLTLQEDGNWSYNGPSSFAGYTYKVSLYATDTAGNTSDPKETKVYQQGGDIYEDPDGDGIPDDYYDPFPSEANVIVVNHPTPQPHTFHFDKDVDWVKFYGTEGQIYTIEAANLGLNCPVIRVYLEDNLTDPIPLTSGEPDENKVWWNFVGIDKGIYYVQLFRDGCEWVDGKMNYDLKVYDNNLSAPVKVGGKVRNSVTGDGIDGVVIKCLRGIGAVISDHGEYQFYEYPGSYTITATKNGYAMAQRGIVIESGDVFVWQDITMHPQSTEDCRVDADCDDELFCNGAETCIDRTCQPGTQQCADDEIFCNGEETCSEETDSCAHTGNPCSSTTICDEEQNACAGCLEDADCPDDGFFCNGTQTCVDRTCKPGTSPCPEGVECDDDADACLLPTLEVIPQVIMQSHWLPLPVFMSIRGTNTHFSSSSEPPKFNPPSVMALPLLINQETLFCIGLMMPTWITGPLPESLELNVTTGKEKATGSVAVFLMPFMMGEEMQETEVRMK